MPIIGIYAATSLAGILEKQSRLKYSGVGNRPTEGARGDKRNIGKIINNTRIIVMAAPLVKRAGKPSIPGYPENSDQRVVNRKVFIISVIALEPSPMIVERCNTLHSVVMPPPWCRAARVGTAMVVGWWRSICRAPIDNAPARGGSNNNPRI